MKSNNFIIWLMGPTSSGKTTIAKAFTEEMRKNGKIILHYDGDEVRDFFGLEHGFTESDRQRVVSTLVHLSQKAYNAGINVVVSALTAHNEARQYIKENVDALLIGYIECSIQTCANRDPKGLYAKAKNGLIDTLVGFNTKYNPPDAPDIVLNTEKKSVNELVIQLTNHLFPKNSHG